MSEHADVGRREESREDRDGRALPANRGDGNPGVFLVPFFGIILPVIAVVVELSLHICADAFFNPLPSEAYVILFLTMPAFNAFLWYRLRTRNVERPEVLQLLNGCALGVSFLYTLLFLPILPIAVIAIIFMGLGLCALAPLLSLVFGLLLTRSLRIQAALRGPLGLGSLWLGLGLSFAILMALNVHPALTRLGMRAALSESADQSTKAIRLLRAYGQREAMLRACYERPGLVADAFSFMLTLSRAAVEPEEARRVYFLVTGEPFNSVPPPRLTGERRWSADDQFEFGNEEGGRFVGARLKGLDLEASRIDGSLDADAALGYLEWTLTFRNSTSGQQEAKAQVALPAGGVVSRATLWIHGEEKEAAFGSRAQTTAAYDEVVSRRRDPLLVTTSGRDRVTLECFPVPPSGRMKIRLGVTFPLLLESRSHAMFRLPVLAERNFSIPTGVRHSVWMEAKSTLGARIEGLRQEGAGKVRAVRGHLTDSQLSSNGAVIDADRDGEVASSWSVDPLGMKNAVAIQTIETKKTLDAPRRLVLVIDGSKSMERHRDALLKAMGALPGQAETSALLSCDGLASVPASRGEPFRARLAALMKDTDFEGGRDSSRALLAAWEQGSAAPGSAILWIHGAQPVELGSVELLLQGWERRPGNPVLYSVPVESGPNVILRRLGDRREIIPVPRTGALEEDLEKLFRRLSEGATTLAPSRKLIRGDGGPPVSGARETSAHLARLAAYDEITRLLGEKGLANPREALALAVRYQLVTPVSGAVVLESREQFEKAGLKPVNPDTVPTVPEPETAVLMVVVAAALLWHAAGRGRRRTSRA